MHSWRGAPLNRPLNILERRWWWWLLGCLSFISTTSSNTAARLLIRYQAAVRKEQHLDGDGQGQVQDQDEHEQNLARLLVGGAQDRVQVAQEEGYRQAEPNSDEDPVEDADLAPADQGDGDPDEVGVSIQSPALEQVR